MLFNKNGIIKQAQLAKDIQANAEAREEEQLKNLEDYVVQNIKNVNAPDISGFDKNSTYYVSWNTSKSTYTINDTTLISKTEPSDWYDYTEGINKWANIKTTGGGNDCYWVWIPRYAYCITEGYHSNVAGTVDIKFLKGTTNTPIDGSSIKISNSSGSGNWNVHPAFWFDKNNNGVEDDGEQLAGIWVAKYEASSNSTDVVENPTVEQLTTNGGGNTTDLKVRVKPNVTSWRGINVNSVFTVCRNLTTGGNSLENTNNLDSHMMKNTEWGAVAYLSRSVYGKNSEVWNNPYYTNYSPITGLCGNAPDYLTNIHNDVNIYKYNTEKGINASTTGNVYGIYDMAGGSWEYVAGIIEGKKTYGDNTAKDNFYNFNNINIYSNKYFNWYAGNSDKNDVNYNANAGRYGDAMYETSTETGTTPPSAISSWDSDYSVFISTNMPVLLRGGRSGDGNRAGIFAFYYTTGGSFLSSSFRPVAIRIK